MRPYGSVIPLALGSHFKFQFLRQPYKMFIRGGSVLTASGPIPIPSDAGINWELRWMVQEGLRQLRFRRSLISGLECIMKQSTHKLLRVSYIKMHPGVMQQSEMLIVPVEVYIRKQCGMLMEPDQQ